MTDPELTKLRLIYERAKREADAAEAAALRARELASRACGSYRERGRKLGLCVDCGNALGQCACTDRGAQASEPPRTVFLVADGCYSDYGVYGVYSSADEPHAIKIANERRTQALAQGTWIDDWVKERGY